MARNYKNIKAWMLAKKFALEIYQKTKNFPKEEVYGITSQIRRAAVSVVANIAEGATRQHKKDYLNFLYTSKASLSETECLVGISNELGFLEDEKFKSLDLLCQDTAKSLYGLIRSVESEL